MAHTWVFNCTLKLSQGTCSKWKCDPSSRGFAQQIGGCPSCEHRKPDNPATAKAEEAHKDT